MPKEGTYQEVHWKRFEHPLAFWFGATATAVGVALHIPMYYSARGMGYRMVGMHPDPEMLVGMALIVLGLVSALYGLLPKASTGIQNRAAKISVRALDEASIRPQHVAMLLVISVAIAIDVMKPAALSFVASGMAKEYNLKSATNPHGHAPVALLALSGVSGMVLGSWFWGWLGDRIGRRSTIIYAGLLFVSTSICGAMPGFDWNLLMCFFMGIGVGGMLPITFALIAETVPARHRGWLLVLIGGGVAGAGYAITSWLATALIPHYSWRIMWLIGLPTGAVFIALNYWIPESPRFLLAAGRPDEAKTIMDRFGATVVAPANAEDVTVPADPLHDGYRELFAQPFFKSSIAITILALGAGLATYGFQLWIPTNLEHLGYTTVDADATVRNAALLGLPLSILATVMYGFWGSRKTIVTSFGVMVLALISFLVTGNSLAHDHVALTALLAIPLPGASLVAAVVTAYAAEIYPTRIRAHGTGLASGATKVGGVLIIALVVAATTTPSIALTAVIGAVPIMIGIVIFTVTGQETRRRGLEQINEAEPTPERV